MAKLLEFLAGCTILIQVIGEYRVESFARRMRAWRVRMTEVQPVRLLSTRLNSVFSRAESGLGKSRSQRPVKPLPPRFVQWVHRVSSAIAIAAAACSYWVQFEWSLRGVLGNLLISALFGGIVYIAPWALMFLPTFVAGLVPWDFWRKPWLDKILQAVATAISCSFLWMTVVELLRQMGPLVHPQWSLRAVAIAPFIILFVAYILFAGYMAGVLFSLLILYVLAIGAFLGLLPCVWIADRATALLAFIMSRTGAVRFLLVVALLSLVSGFLIDFATS